MKVRYTTHGGDQARRRRVTEDDILSALSNYGISRPGDDGATLYLGRIAGGRELAVVLLPPGLTGPDCTVVVKSVWWRGEED